MKSLQLIIHDSKGENLQLGDWLRVSNRNTRNTHQPFSFYVQFQIKDGKLIPFENFGYDYIEKVSGPPEGLEPSNEGVYFVRGLLDNPTEEEQFEYRMSAVLFDKIKSCFFTIKEAQ